MSAQQQHPDIDVFVDPFIGNDTTGTGSKFAPMASLGAAAGLLSALRKTGGRIFLGGCSNPISPYPGSASITADSPITIAPWGPGRWNLLGGPSNSYGLRIIGSSTVTLFRASVIGQGTAGIRLGDTGLVAGELIAYDSYAEGQVNGWQTAGVWTALNAIRCQGLGRDNDGFNIHGDAGVRGLATLDDCVGVGCGDEGVSPHDDTRLDIYGGLWFDNGGGGAQAVNNAVMNIRRSRFRVGERAIFNRNRNDHGPAANIGYYDNASGVIDGGTATEPLSGAANYQNLGIGIVTLTDLITD